MIRVGSREHIGFKRIAGGSSFNDYFYKRTQRMEGQLNGQAQSERVLLHIEEITAYLYADEEILLRRKKK